MDLIKLVYTEDGLQQDEWSLTAPTFGKGGYLEIVGHNGGKGNKKYYILRCSKCSQDPELFGEGYFRSSKSHLLKGAIPCGCAKMPKWTKEQYFVRCSRKATELGYTFLEFTGEWEGHATKVLMSCEKHGEWATGIADSLINGRCGCPACARETLVSSASISNTKTDDEMIASFFRSGAFNVGTKFWRSDRKNTKGYTVYWYMSCPECGEVGQSQSGNLQRGQRPCACSRMRQQECYINLVYEVQNLIAVKFGISRDSKQRIKKQDRLSAYTLKQYGVYRFPSVQQCKQAEIECLQELECGVVLRRDMPDGYTETTWPYNLEKIIEIYERNGGVRNE